MVDDESSEDDWYMSLIFDDWEDDCIFDYCLGVGDDDIHSFPEIYNKDGSLIELITAGRPRDRKQMPCAHGWT
jgi:hypothetical protein